jgi:hypothetical protein
LYPIREAEGRGLVTGSSGDLGGNRGWAEGQEREAEPREVPPDHAAPEGTTGSDAGGNASGGAGCGGKSRLAKSQVALEPTHYVPHYALKIVAVINLVRITDVGAHALRP